MSCQYEHILKKCIAIGNDREKDYGPATTNIQKTAAITKSMFGISIQPSECVAVIIANKLSRQDNKKKEDNIIDLINYFAIYQLLLEIECEVDKQADRIEPAEVEIKVEDLPF